MTSRKSMASVYGGGDGGGSTAATTAAWWKPPGLMDVSDADLLDASSSFSGALHVGRTTAGNTAGGARSTATTRPHSTLVDRVEQYVATPNVETLAGLYQLTRRPTTSVLQFATQHASLCLRLLDALADHTLRVTKTAPHGDPAKAPATSSPPAATPELQQLLDVLYLFSRGAPIGYPSHPLGKLLQWLAASVVSLAMNGCGGDHPTIFKLQLLVIAEMLKVNAGVRIYIKELKKVKEFYRALTILLNSTEDAEFLVYSMAILARLVLSDTLGAKLFSSKNVEQAIELVGSVLDGTWDSGGAESADGAHLVDLLRHTAVLQCVSVDLLCDLSDRTDILTSLEKNAKVAELMETMVGMVHLNGSQQQIQIAVHFLTAMTSLGHHFRKQVIRYLSDHDHFPRLLQVLLHPSKMLAILSADLLLKIFGDDFRPFRGSFESSLQPQQLSPIVAGLFRLLNEASMALQQNNDVESVTCSEEYLLSVSVSQLLVKLTEFSEIRAICVQTISLNKSAGIIQVESGSMSSPDVQEMVQFQPRLAIHVVMLLSRLSRDPSMEDKHKRTLNQFLQSAEVASVLGAAFFNHNDKDLVVDTLLLFNQFIGDSTNKRFQALSLAEGIVNVGQRQTETTDSLQSTILSLKSNSETHMKTIEKLHGDIQQILRLQEDGKARQDQEIAEIKTKYLDQIRQKEEIFSKAREIYENKLQELNSQCESMAVLMNKKIGALQHREQQLHETRTKRSQLDEENNELKRKVQVLEVRLEEIAQSHSITAEEIKLRDQELKSLQDELSTLSSDYACQREELQEAQDVIKKLEADADERTASHDNTFKELVLLSKAHKALADEKDELLKEMDAMRDELSNLESFNVSIQARLVEKKELVEQVERKLKRFEDAAAVSQSALEDEREKRRAVSRDLEDMRKAHRKLESDIAMSEIRTAEMRLVVESKDEHIRKCEDEIRHLTLEVNKQAKLQALIHQLSSGGDTQGIAATAYLARDS